MKKILVRKDILIEEGLETIYAVLYIIYMIGMIIMSAWVIIFLLYFFSWKIAFFVPIVEKITDLLFIPYEQYCFKSIGWSVMSPFIVSIATIAFKFFSGICSKIRNWLYPANKFTIVHTACILKKGITSTFHTNNDGPDYETTHLFFIVKNPFKEDTTLLYDDLDSLVYCTLEVGDTVFLKTTPNGRWIVLLAC